MTMTRPTAPYRHLRPGHFYRLDRSFTDHDGRLHTAGICWRFHGHSFLPYEDGLSLFFVDETGHDLHIRLQNRPQEQAAIIDALDRYLVASAPPTRAARASLRDIENGRLAAFDGVDTIWLVWPDIRRVTAAYGRQQYDMTRCFEIDHRRGTSIFLPETDPTWPRFISEMTTHLAGAIPESNWSETLAQHPENAITIWRRPHILHRLFAR